MTWSRLTPSRFPVELTAGPPGTGLHWTAEVAGPELPDAERLECAAELLGEAGQPIGDHLLAGIKSLQHGAIHGWNTQHRPVLRYGAWLGGRDSAESATRLKLYAELPVGADIASLRLPAEIEAARHLLDGAVPRMLGIEPAAERVELYLRLADRGPAQLAPFLHAVGHQDALGALDRGLVDGLRRLYGRRLGLSLAAGPDPGLELALFVTARTLYAVKPAMLLDIAPQLTGLDPRWQPGPVTLGLDPTGRRLPVAVGLAPRYATMCAAGGGAAA